MVCHLIGPGMKIGHEQIDAEHQDLLDSINRCADLVKVASYAEAEVALRALRAQLAQHVEKEEAIMEAFGYDNLARDSVEHKRGLSELDDLLQAHLIPDYWDSERGEALIYKITSLLMELFLRSDLGFKGHLQKIGYFEA